MAALCEHLEDIPLDPMPEGGCDECLKIGGTWVHLRYCIECGGTFCCNDSPNQHSQKHAKATGHPVIRSKEPGEHWAWCYVHKLGVETRP